MLPLIAILRTTFNGARLAIAAAALGWLAVTTAPSWLILYLPLLAVWVLAPSYRIARIEQAVWSLRRIFILSLVYGLIQKTVGYLPHEISWITSGLGVVSAEGFFLTEDIRPFSFYSGIPEFGFFSALVGYIAYRRQSKLYVALALAGLVLAGSRGVIVSTGIAVGTLMLRRYLNHRLVIPVSFASAVAIYAVLALWVPVEDLMQGTAESRLMVYGTFNSRVQTLTEFWSLLNLSNLWFGVGVPLTLFDNFYLTLVNDFGLFVAIAFVLALVFRARGQASMFFSSAVLSYCLYADALFSVPFAFPSLLLILAKE